MKYLDYDGLQAYDNSIKNYIDNNVPDLAQAANLATALKNAADPTSSVKIALCTQAEYGALESYEENVIYIITDDTSGVVYTYANETLDGTESVLTSITIQGIKYAIPQGTEITANPVLDGTETNLSGLQIGNTRYAVGGGGSSIYEHNISIAYADSSAGRNLKAFFKILNNDSTPFEFNPLRQYLTNNYPNGIGASGYVIKTSQDDIHFCYYVKFSANANTIWLMYLESDKTENFADISYAQMPTITDTVRQIQ